MVICSFATTGIWGLGHGAGVWEGVPEPVSEPRCPTCTPSSASLLPLHWIRGESWQSSNEMIELLSACEKCPLDESDITVGPSTGGMRKYTGNRTLGGSMIQRKGRG